MPDSSFGDGEIRLIFISFFVLTILNGTLFMSGLFTEKQNPPPEINNATFEDTFKISEGMEIPDRRGRTNPSGAFIWDGDLPDEFVFRDDVVIDSFEDGDMQNNESDPDVLGDPTWNTTGPFEPVSGGHTDDESWHVQNNGSAGTATLDEDAYTDKPLLGPNRTYRFYYNQLDDTNQGVHPVGIAQNLSSEEGIEIRFQPWKDEVAVNLEKHGTVQDSASMAFLHKANTWYETDVVWNADGTVTVTIRNETGGQKGSVTVSDSAFTKANWTTTQTHQLVMRDKNGHTVAFDNFSVDNLKSPVYRKMDEVNIEGEILDIVVRQNLETDSDIIVQFRSQAGEKIEIFANGETFRQLLIGGNAPANANVIVESNDWSYDYTGSASEGKVSWELNPSGGIFGVFSDLFALISGIVWIGKAIVVGIFVGIIWIVNTTVTISFFLVALGAFAVDFIGYMILGWANVIDMLGDVSSFYPLIVIGAQVPMYIILFNGIAKVVKMLPFTG